MYYGKKVSVVFPCYNEEENIKNAIEEFLANPAVDELIVVDNNSKDKSAEEIKKTSAVYVLETTQGYGSAMKRGMSEATGDLIVTVEPDGTFTADDLERLLVYSKEYEVVIGTRTSRNPIWSGGDPKANMDFALRIGNWAVAKFLEYLFGGPSFTDVGCSYKLIHWHAYEKIKHTLTVNGSWFSPEYMIRVLQLKLRTVEIPVRYGARIGTSKITGDRVKAIQLGFKMIRFIFWERLISWPRPVVILVGTTLLLTLIPLLEIGVFLGPSWTGILPNYTDELNFARVHSIGEGYLTDGNAYFLEHANGKPLVLFGGAWLNAIPLWLHIALFPALYLNFIFWSLAFVLMLYWLLRELRAPPMISLIGTLVLYIQSLEHVWRPANLQPIYPFYFLFYTALLRFIRNPVRSNRILLSLTIGISFYLFAYLWQIALITLGLLFLYFVVRKDFGHAKETFITTAIGGIIGAPVPLYMLYVSRTSSYFWESMKRLGLVNTHIPMAETIYSGGWIGLTIAFVLLILWRVPSLRSNKDVSSIGLFLVTGGFGLWIMQASNLITGKQLETGEHVRLLIAPWLMFAFIACACIAWKHFRDVSRTVQQLALAVLTILAAVNTYLVFYYFSPFIPMASDRAFWAEQQKYAGPFNWLNEHDKGGVVIWSNPHDVLSSNLPVYTKDFTLYTYWGMLELVPEGEVRERYLISQYFNNPTVETFKTDSEMAVYLGRHDYPHQAKTLEREVKVCRIIYFWDAQKDCGTIRSSQDLLGDAFFTGLESRFTTDIKPNIKAYLEKYHVSYILKDKQIDTNYHPEELGALLVYSDDRYELYHL